MRELIIYRLWVVIWLFLLVACQQVEATPSDSDVEVALGAPSATATLLPVTPLSTSLPLPTTPLKVTAGKSSSPVERQEQARGVVPVVGGLAAPEEVPWFLPNSQEPLAYLLAQHLHRSLFDPLTGESELVAEWQVVGEQATLILKANAAWSDGSPLRAADVVDLLLQAKENGELVGLKEARVIDFNVLQLLLDSPACSALMRVATWPIVDVREWPPLRTSNNIKVYPKGIAHWSIESTQPVGEKKFEYRTYPDELSLREAYERGEINSVLGGSRLKMGPLQGPQQSSERSGPILASLIFRISDPLLKEVKVREALTLATDREVLFLASYGTNAPNILTALLPANHWAAPKGQGGEGAVAALTAASELLSDEGGQDLEHAEELLSEAGWEVLNEEGVRINTRGEPLRLTLTLPLSSDQRWEALGKELARQWGEIGVELIPFYVESYSLQERLHTERWQIALLAYIVSPEPDQRALWSIPSPSDMLAQDMNITGYQNASVVELMKQGTQVTDCTPQKRAAFYHSAWEQLLSDRPLWPLFALPLDEIHRPEVKWLGD